MPFIFLNNRLHLAINLTTRELIQHAQEQLGSAHIASAFFTWDFVRDEGGKIYEVQVCQPNREVVPATELPGNFKNGFAGNTAAFIAWVIQNNPKGCHASIPEEDRLLPRCIKGKVELAAPSYAHVGNTRGELRLSMDTRRKWGQSWSYVAFREISAR